MQPVLSGAQSCFLFLSPYLKWAFTIAAQGSRLFIFLTLKLPKVLSLYITLPCREHSFFYLSFLPSLLLLPASLPLSPSPLSSYPSMGVGVTALEVRGQLGVPILTFPLVETTSLLLFTTVHSRLAGPEAS